MCHKLVFGNEMKNKERPLVKALFNQNNLLASIYQPQNRFYSTVVTVKRYITIFFLKYFSSLNPNGWLVYNLLSNVFKDWHALWSITWLDMGGLRDFFFFFQQNWIISNKYLLGSSLIGVTLRLNVKQILWSLHPFCTECAYDVDLLE